MNSFSKIVDILLLVLLMFIIPLEYTAQKQDNINQTVVTSQTSIFTDAVRNKGYIDKEMYEMFLKKLSLTGNVYDVNIECYKKVYTSDNIEQYTMDYEYCDNDSIINSVYSENGKYCMNIGDLIHVRVKSKGSTLGEKMQSIVLKKDINSGIYVEYGGVIRDETN